VISKRPIALSIAGFDPSGGAGLLADCKTFEEHHVLGLGVCTAITYQTENKFLGLTWQGTAQLEKQLVPILDQYQPKFIKIGLINFEQLNYVLSVIPKRAKIVWDPILNASAGFDFNNCFDPQTIKSLLPSIYLVTPNLPEFEILHLNQINGVNVLLKGGHSEKKDDLLILANTDKNVILGQELEKGVQKHGTGCILSAAIVANLAKDLSLLSACSLAKRYVEDCLISNTSLLAYHSK
jgi:hydroxymethylpyrimidine/phosphomethylpyrimidine kinase